MTSAEHLQKPGRCPTCGHRFDRSSNVDKGDQRAPEPGALSVCIECGEFLQFTETMDLRKLPTEAFDALEEDLREYLVTIRKTVLQIRLEWERRSGRG